MAERITVYPETGGSLVLTSADHVATGGEGAVYLKGGTVYKVFLDPAKAIAAGMERKVPLLSALRHPGIAAPTGLLRNKQGQLLGLSLPRANGEALCKLFTNTWRDNHQFGAQETARVVDAMRDITRVAHAHNALMVDANELNWLVAGTQPVAIDVDSWQLPGFPATAIMPSIRDYSAAAFTPGSDWFAWAVVTFQLWTGIHPYKGTHPDFARSALEARMRARASVFDARVRLPGAVRPLTDIPPVLRNWYEQVLAGTERSEPPSATASAIAPQSAPRLRVRQTLAGALRLERLGLAGEKVLAAFNGFVIARKGPQLELWDAVAKAAVPLATQEELTAVLHRQAGIVRTPQARVLVSLLPGASEAVARVLDTGDLALLGTRAQKLWQSGNRIFALIEGASNGLHEVSLSHFGQKLTLTVARQWPVGVLSTQFFRGAFVQDCLGAPFLGVLESDGLLQAAAPDLKRYRISEGFAVDRHNVWLSGVRTSDGESVRLRMTHQVDRFVLEEEEVVATLELDGAATVAGVGVIREGQDLLVAKGLVRKRVVNSGLSDDARLFSLGAGIAFFEDGSVVRVSLG